MDVTEDEGARAARIRARLDRPLVFIGMMGAGKSRLGRATASALGLPFIDTDKEIEAAAGCSVADIFARDGEAAFRAAEARTVQAHMNGQPCVVATGGGAVVNPDTADAVFNRDRAVSIWLRAPAETLLDRVRHAGDRPLLHTPDPLKTLQTLLAQRTPIYSRAQLTVECDGRPITLVLDEILQSVHGVLYYDV